jgi:hypothetical protein
MASRLIKKTAILAKLETTYGTDAVPTGAANAMLASNLSVNPLNANNVDRALIRAYFGSSEQLVGTRYMECGFDVELVGSGVAGTPPAWGPLMRSIGFAETITAALRVDYTPISDDIESATIYWYDDGVLHKLLGVRGTATMDLSVGVKPVISFKFIGIYGGIAEQAAPATTLTAWKVPQIVVNAQSGDVTLGATHSATTAPALIGGTPVTSQGLTIDLGITATFQPLLGEESVEVTDRNVTGAIKLKMSAAQEVEYMNKVLLAELSSVGLQHGTVDANKIQVFMPSVQFTTPTKEELNGQRLIGYALRAVPVAGNDEFRLTCF